MSVRPDVPVSALRADGARTAIRAAAVRGRFANRRAVAYAVLIAIYALLPWVTIGGHPAVFLDIDARRFYLFGVGFNTLDVWMMTFLLLGSAFILLSVTALFGRLWCGWGCPQTVFVDGVCRRIERVLAPGHHAGRVSRLVRGAATQLGYLVVALVVAHIFLSYFVSLRGLFSMMTKNPGQHPEAFALVMSMTGLMYFDFAFFREQTCLILCPYGRLQSILLDSDSLVVGYDEKRGEPRGKAKDQSAGACVDCLRCVAVCPMGIDIRNGYQLDCTACTACIDACDEIMDRLSRPRGLIRYDSLNGLAGQPRRIWRPRVFAYAGLLVVVFLAAWLAFRTRTDFDATLLRLQGAPFVLEDGNVRNSYRIQLANKRKETATFTLEPVAFEGATFVLPAKEVTLEPLAQSNTPLFVSIPRALFPGDFVVHVRVRVGDEQRLLEVPFLGPRVRSVRP